MSALYPLTFFSIFSWIKTAKIYSKKETALTCSNKKTPALIELGVE